jgi:tRNA dimethylallyltransferase
MIKRGLIAELVEMRDKCSKGLAYGSVAGKPLDYTRGILQSIGFKEFHEYLKVEDDFLRSKECFDKAVEDMKLATRQYARKQCNWLKNKLLKRSVEEKLDTYVLDASGMLRHLL